MKNVIKLMTLVVVMMVANGCLSYGVLDGSKKIVAMRKAVQRNDAAAIRALKDGDRAGAGIDVGTWEALKERGVLQTGAAIGDALLVWGGYEGVKWIKEDNDDDDNTSNSTSTSRDNSNVTINGNGNEVNVHLGNTEK